MSAPCEVVKANVDIRSDVQYLFDTHEQYPVFLPNVRLLYAEPEIN